MPLPSRLNLAIEYTKARSLLPLEMSLRGIRAATWHRSGVKPEKVAPELNEIIHQCQLMGATQLEGRSRFLAWRLLTPNSPPEDRLCTLLKHDKPRLSALQNGTQSQRLW